MKLLSVITTMNPLSGGPAQGIRNNMPFWQAHGVDPMVVCLDDPTEVFTQDSRIIALGQPHNRWRYSANLKPWLLAHLLEFDFIIVHGLWLYIGYATMKALKQLRKQGSQVPKLLVMPHGMLDPYFQTSPDRRLKAIRNIFYWHLIEKHLIRFADGILFTCEEELALAQLTFSGYRPKATYNISYGILPPPLYSPTQQLAFENICPAVAGKPYFLFLSRIHPKKGIDLLLQAYRCCYNDFLKKGCSLPALVIAGPGLDTAFGTKLHQHVSNDPLLASTVYFVGMLQGDAKWGALHGCDLFLLPSHQENFGIAIVEAMACKTAVVVSNKVNIWREIEAGKGGILVNDTMQSLTEGIVNWVNLSKDAQTQMGLHAYNTYLQHFMVVETSRNSVDVMRAIV
jgi:glycosyltransferase involved in cell wall biosynthesis